MIIPAPVPPSRQVDWDRFDATYECLGPLTGCPQEPEFHGEGDVRIHTELVVDALLGEPRFATLDPTRRDELLTAAVLHDVGKPPTTRVEDGRIRQPGHARRGEITARVALWRQGVPAEARERIANLIRFHLQPFHLLDRELPTERLFHASWACDGTESLLQLARADALGRISTSRDELVERVDLARLLADEHATLDGPYPFASDHSRVRWFRRPEADPAFARHDDTTVDVLLLSGLPASGKDHWIATHAPERPVVSLDGLRAELGIAPTGNQGPVIQAAREQARVHLRARRPFVWNATSLSRRVRRQCLELFLAYGARVHLVAVEAPPTVIAERNRARARPVPDAVLARMLDVWEAPDPSEAHQLSFVDGCA